MALLCTLNFTDPGWLAGYLMIPMPRSGTSCRRITIFGWLAILLGACEVPFEPIQPSNLVYSIHGHLDASASRQWVRVAPIRSSLIESPGPIDAVVTLEEIETGERIAMTDSLAGQAGGPSDTAVSGRNFTTTMRMVPGRHYRLTATRSDGAQSSATVLIPVVENPRLTSAGRARNYVLGVPYLAMALAIYELETPCTSSTHEEFLPVHYYGGGEGDPPIIGVGWVSDVAGRPSDIPPPPPQCNPARRSTRIIASGAPWPWRFDRRVSAPLGSASNIEGGVGFLAGVQSVCSIRSGVWAACDFGGTP